MNARAIVRLFAGKVNGTYVGGGPRPIPEPKGVVPAGTPRLSSADMLKRDKAREPLWSDPAKVSETTNAHSLYSWGATGVVSGSAIHVARGEGIYFYDTAGKKYIDFNSQAMCSHFGHTMPDEVHKLISDQLRMIPYTYPCYTATPIKAKLSALLADIFPGDINTFFYTTGGTESNETALRMAKVMTKRHKVLAKYRSYHGATAGSIALTGDPRRWPSEPGFAGVIHVMDPYPYNYSWDAKTEEELTQKNLQYLAEVIAFEGGHNIAAFFIEPVTGTNGILKQPKGYLEGVRALCDQHGILMVADEVMNGFGRTGKWFGFEHTNPTVLPDIVCTAKGINGAFLPLGCVAVRDHVADYFRKNAISIGSTYNSHPATLASSYGMLRWALEHNVLDNVVKMSKVMTECMEVLASKHVCIKQARNVGLFGVIEVQGNAKTGEWLVGYAGTPHPALVAFRNELLKNGLFTLARWDQIYCNPPLIINEEELRRSFDIIDNALSIVDKVVKQ